MSWLAKIDTRAARWPLVLRWPYRGLKYFLIVMGAYLIVGRAVTEYLEGRLGLGLGVAVAGGLALIKGIVMAVTAEPSPPHPTDSKSR